MGANGTHPKTAGKLERWRRKLLVRYLIYIQKEREHESNSNSVCVRENKTIVHFLSNSLESRTESI